MSSMGHFIITTIINIIFIFKSMLLLSKDTLNGSKVKLKTFIMLLKIFHYFIYF